MEPKCSESNDGRLRPNKPVRRVKRSIRMSDPQTEEDLSDLRKLWIDIILNLNSVCLNEQVDCAMFLEGSQVFAKSSYRHCEVLCQAFRAYLPQQFQYRDCYELRGSGWRD